MLAAEVERQQSGFGASVRKRVRTSPGRRSVPAPLGALSQFQTLT